MSINPEFRRNVWLECSPSRLGVTTLAIGSLLGLAYAGERTFGIRVLDAAELLFSIIIFLWGSRLAAEAVVQEINERTWDAQRMSALDPWAMSWGKLFGAPLAAWFGGALCLLAMTLAESDAVERLSRIVSYVGLGVLCHATALLLSLQSVRKAREPGRMRVFVFQILGIAATLPFAFFAVWTSDTVRDDRITWFDFPLSIQNFAMLSILLFAGWAIVGVYRLMRLELQKPATPLVWLLFVLFVLIYQTGCVLGGFNLLEELTGRDLPDQMMFDRVTAALVFGEATAVLLVYVAIFTEPKNVVEFRQIFLAIRTRDMARLLQNLPRWAVTLAVTFVLLIAALAFSDLPAGIGRQTAHLDVFLIASFLFLLRNVGIVLLVHVMPGFRRGDLGAFIILIVLQVIIPLILDLLGIDALRSFFAPSWRISAVPGLLPVFAQIVLVYGLLALKWHQSERRRAAAA